MREMLPVPNYSGRETESVVSTIEDVAKESANDDTYEQIEKNALETIEDLKRQIEDINTTVREGKLGTTLADQLVADLEQQIYAAERRRRSEIPALEIVERSSEEDAIEQIDRLKSEVEHINALVRENKMNTTLADQLVATLEQQIRSEEQVTYTPSILKANPAREQAISKMLETGPVELTSSEVSFETEVIASEDEEEFFPKEGETEAETSHEYVVRKREFKQAKKAYLATLEHDYADRNILKKTFGLGRKALSPQVEQAHDVFMAANQAYYNHAQRSGHYERVATRLNRERTAEELLLPINSLVADRHILRPAKERLELQQVHLPEGVTRLKQAISERIRKNPKVALGVGALVAVLNPAAVLTGLGVRYVGNKFYVGSKEATEQQVTAAAIAAVDGIADLRSLEEKQFESVRQTHDARIRTNATAIGAAIVAGGAYNSSEVERIVPTEEISGYIDFDDSLGVRGEGLSETGAVSTSVEASASETEAAPVAASETFVLDRTSITAEGELVFLTPEGITTNSSIEVVSPFANEVPYLKVPGEELIDAMIDRIEADVRSGVITLELGQSLSTLREQIIVRYPELTGSGNTAAPGLSSEVWQQIGVSGGNPSEIPNGTKINMERLLNEVFGIRLEGELMEGASDLAKSTASTPVPEIPTIPPAEIAPVIPTETTTETTMITSSDRGEFQKMLDNTRDHKPIESVLNELAERDFQPAISERLVDLTTPWQPGKTLHEHLYRTMLEGYRNGNITLPIETMRYVAGNETALYGFIERHLPDVSDDVLSKFFRGVSTEAMSPEEWRALGIESGNPKMIAAGDQVQTGNIIKLILERAAGAANKS